MPGLLHIFSETGMPVKICGNKDVQVKEQINVNVQRYFFI